MSHANVALETLYFESFYDIFENVMHVVSLYFAVSSFILKYNIFVRNLDLQNAS